MITVRKICQLILIAAFVCVFNAPASYAQLANNNAQNSSQSWTGIAANSALGQLEAKASANTFNSRQACENSCKAAGHRCVDNTIVGSSGTWTCVDYSKATEQASNAGAGTNTPPSESAVTGCSSNYGLFSGLINTGSKIFNGLRDLIYVVAGFGIIGVAVGGFFGNLNWKWLGAIVISLVVIASTGELINLITGCDGFTSAAKITSTLINPNADSDKSALGQ